jgi:hypothetical protein
MKRFLTQKLTPVMTILLILLFVSSAYATFALGTKLRVRVTTNVNQWVQSVSDLTSVQTIFAGHSIANCKRVLISVDNTSANYLTDLDIRLSDDNNNMADSYDIVGGVSSGAFLNTGWSDCTVTLAATTKCYALLPSNSGFTHVDLTAAATTVATITTELNCWR